MSLALVPKRKCVAKCLYRSSESNGKYSPAGRNAAMATSDGRRRGGGRLRGYRGGYSMYISRLGRRCKLLGAGGALYQRYEDCMHTMSQICPNMQSIPIPDLHRPSSHPTEVPNPPEMLGFGYPSFPELSGASGMLWPEMQRLTGAEASISLSGAYMVAWEAFRVFHSVPLDVLMSRVSRPAARGRCALTIHCFGKGVCTRAVSIVVCACHFTL